MGLRRSSLAFFLFLWFTVLFALTRYTSAQDYLDSSEVPASRDETNEAFSKSASILEEEQNVDGKRVVAKEERDSEALSGEREEGEKPKPTSEMSPDEWTAMPGESESESLSKGGDVVKEEDSRSEEQQEHKPEEKKREKGETFSSSFSSSAVGDEYEKTMGEGGDVLQPEGRRVNEDEINAPKEEEGGKETPQIVGDAKEKEEEEKEEEKIEE